MLESLTVDDPRVAALFAHPRRRRILLSLIDAERTRSELAGMTETPLSLLHHHLGALLRAGLVEVTHEVARAGAPLRYHRLLERRANLSLCATLTISKTVREGRPSAEPARSGALNRALQGASDAKRA